MLHQGPGRRPPHHRTPPAPAARPPASRTGPRRHHHRTTTAGHGRTGPATTAMAARLATTDAITAYRNRGHIAETPHGQIKHNMRFRQLCLRGKTKAAAEWTFTAAVHNIFKAITTGHLTTTALATLPVPAPTHASPA